MDTPTAPTDWRTALTERGSTISWLADAIGWKRRTVYAYSRGSLKATPEFLEAASRVLGREVTDTLVVTVTREFADGSAA